jgi:hypothetical protein
MEFFEATDADGDSVLTFEEYKVAYGKADEKVVAENFDAMVPTQAEDRTRLTQHMFNEFLQHEAHAHAKHFWAALDKDENHVISKAELLEAEDIGARLEL